MRRSALALAAVLLAAPAVALPVVSWSAQPERTYQRPDAPIAATVTVPAGSEIIYLSGQIPPPGDPTAPKGSTAAWGGDTEAQGTAVVQRIEATLKGLNLTLGDVVMMRVYLAGDPAKGGAMDFAGWQKAYAKFFGTKDQPNRPARSTFQVAALAAPGALVEVEVTAVRTKK